MKDWLRGGIATVVILAYFMTIHTAVYFIEHGQELLGLVLILSPGLALLGMWLVDFLIWRPFNVKKDTSNNRKM